MDEESKEQRPETLGKLILSWWQRYRFRIEIFAFIFLGLSVYLWNYIHISIHSGERGVLYRRFFGGTVTDHTYNEGFHLLWPWDKMYVYEVRAQQFEHQFDVLSEDGLRITVKISIRYRPKIDQLGILHKEIGPEYVERILVPEVQSALRVLIGQYDPEEIYQTQRSIIENAVKESLLQVAEEYIELDDLLIKSIELPPMVRQAIERKLTQEQVAKEFEYRLMQAEQEAKRKKIEAQGIRDFQDIVSEGISNQFLRWHGIEATLELAKSPNSKIIIIGGPSDGLPLILNTGDMVSSGTGTAPLIPNATAMTPAFNTSEYNTSLSTPGGVPSYQDN